MKWIWWGVGSLLAALIESSLLPVPALLFFAYLQLDRGREKVLVWWLFAWGVVLDVLTMRPMGSSSLLVAIFVAGWWLVMRFSAGWWLLETLWLLVVTFGWQEVFWGQFSWWLVPLVLVLVVVSKRRERFSGRGEIKLR